MQAGFYLTPIIYPITLITNLNFRKLIMINPMSQTIQDARYAVVTHKSQTIYDVFKGGWHESAPFLIVVLIFFIGIYYFRKESKYFAENV